MKKTFIIIVIMSFFSCSSNFHTFSYENTRISINLKYKSFSHNFYFYSFSIENKSKEVYKYSNKNLFLKLGNTKYRAHNASIASSNIDFTTIDILPGKTFNQTIYFPLNSFSKKLTIKKLIEDEFSLIYQ